MGNFQKICKFPQLEKRKGKVLFCETFCGITRTNNDLQNYVYSGKFFLSRPLLQWKKRGKNLEKFIGVEQASEHKKINWRMSPASSKWISRTKSI